MAEPPFAVAIDGAFAAAGIDVRLGCLAFTAGELGDDMGTALDEVARRAGRTPVAEVPAIQATRAAYKALGKDPSRYRPASEALWRRLARGEAAPPRILPLVDLNTLVSLGTGFAAGIYDRTALAPPVVLRPGRSGESYPAIGGQAAFNLENLPVLADGAGAFGSPTRDGERARVRERTTAAWLVLFDFGGGDMEGALGMAEAASRRYLGAEGVVAWQVRSSD